MDLMTADIYRKLQKFIKDDTLIKFYKLGVWKKIRRVRIELDNFECQECKRNGKVGKPDMVHHIKTVKEYPRFALQLNNLETLCNSCHNKEHPEKLEQKEKFTIEERW